MQTSLPIHIGIAAAASLFGASSVQGTITDYQSAVRGETSLVSYYTFDAGNADDSKASNNGTPAGVVNYATGVGGGTDKALVLKGTGHINLGAVDAFNFVSGKGTVEAWIRVDWKSSPGYNPAMITDRDGGSVNWSLHMNSGKDAAGMWNGSSYSPLSIPQPGTNWHHFAVVFDTDGQGGSVFTEYWDGSPIGSTQQALGPAPEAPTELGSSSVAGAERWVGGLDEVAFYGDALSASAIKAHYTAFLKGFPPEIVASPRGGTYLAGIPLTLAVDAKGTQLSYRWYKDGLAIAGATNATFTLPALSSADLGSYFAVAVGGDGQEARSDVAQIQLGDLPAKLKQYQAAVRAESSLLSYYTFDTVNAADAKGAHPGTAQGRVQYADGIGAGAGKALLMDGAGHVNLGQVDAFSFPSGKGTVEAWIRADWTNTLGYNPAIIANRDVSDVIWSLHMNDAKDAAGLWNGSTYLPQATPGTGTGWHHLAAVFDTDTSGNASFTLYWDGAPAGTAAQGLGIPTASALPTELGSSSAAGQERWNGALDEVAFYSDALSAAAIQAHYSAFVSGTPPVITQQPQGGSYFLGSPLTLSAGAQGLDLSYAWFKNGSQISGAAAPQLSFAALTAGDSASYRVRVTNTAGSTDSSNAVVQVIVPDLAGYQKMIQQEPGLISYYTFDAADAADAKSVNSGTPVDNAIFLTGVGGAKDLALVVDGTGHIDLGVVSAFDFASGKGTVEAWVRADWTSSPGYNPTIFANRDDAPVDWSVHMSSGKDVAGLWNGATYQPVTTPNTGVSWHHVAAVFDQDSAGSLFTLYWDGAPAGTTRQTIGATTGLPTQLGSASALGQERWIGALDEVAFYSTALTEATVRTHYQALIGAPKAAPTLSFARTGAQIVLSWPAGVAGVILESANALPATSWTAVAGVIGNSMTIDASNGSKFFRLRQP